MGKRRERRLAAMSNAGRRVKLDLFAEPSGDLGGSTMQDNTEGDTDSKDRDGLPNSPSSSGKQPQNPLLLLGQYSDDEQEEEPNEDLKHSKLDITSKNEEANVSEEINNGIVEGLVAQNGEQEGVMESSKACVVVEGGDKDTSDAPLSGDFQKEMSLGDQISIDVTSEVEASGSSSLGWKMVMHEETNQYYYWNTETGETSWEVPPVLAHSSQLTGNQATVDVNERSEVASLSTVDPKMSSTTMEGSLAAYNIDSSVGTTLAAHREPVHRHVSLMDDTDVNQNEFWSRSSLLNETSGGDSSLRVGASHSTEENQSVVDLPFHLLKRSEQLSERLKLLEESKERVDGENPLLTYALEAKIRHFDIKSLASYGSSLRPFWVHCERQLNQLESVIDDKFLQMVKAAHMDKMADAPTPISIENEKCKESLENEYEGDNKEKGGLSADEDSPGSLHINSCARVLMDSSGETTAHDIDASSSGSLPRQLDAGLGVSVEGSGTVVPDEPTHKHGCNDGDDVDMDVDMEVEDVHVSGDTTMVNVSALKNFTVPDQTVQPNAPVECHPLLPNDEFVVPPPPDDEWIPPPPPDNDDMPPPPSDNEQMPPPPSENGQMSHSLPDHPSESSCQLLPSFAGMGQSLSSVEQYNIPYQGASFEYYGHPATEVPRSHIYNNSDEYQAVMPHAQMYYGSIPNTYTESAQVMVNPVEPVAYYGLQGGTVPTVSLTSGVEPSHYQSQSAAHGYNTLVPDQTGTSDPSAGSGLSSIPGVNLAVPDVGGGAEKVSIDVPSTSVTIQAPATTSVEESILVPSTTVASVATVGAASSSVSKAQPKVIRSKKKTVAVGSSLRSNKKVSNLVDKWKAAKEELLEEEDEPESAYEMLERKKQREIEEWHAKQIASGEAKDNANFQPLGGDWRERLKRKRAQSSSEFVETPKIEHEEKQRPDLIEISKDLPSGWQAYWDESSKQVYYGNAVTSRTTWIRPTK